MSEGTDDLVDVMTTVQATLRDVGEAVSALAARGQFDQASEATQEENRRWHRSLALLIMGGPLLFGLSLLILWQSHHNEETFKRDIRQGLSCALGDQSTHRRDARTFEVDVANKLGIPNYPSKLHPASVIPDRELEALTSRCDLVLHRFLSYTLSSNGQMPNVADGSNGGHP